MTVRWRYLEGSTVEVGWSQEFAHREEAEAWLADQWEELAGLGIDVVALVDNDREVFRMSLGPAE
jgi:hypothetical protein